MSNWYRDINVDDFLKWANDPNNRQDLEDMFENEFLPSILEAEENDFFGTEGFDKRFS